ncbi:MAG: SDR family oxidoreductase [Actinomycetia bacterium]|nr:SDR family oxidoreductase [Actinomycetes bacterium]
MAAEHSPRRVLVTDADAFLGPACVERFRSDGDEVTAAIDPLRTAAEVAELVERRGPFDVLIANLDVPIAVRPITAHDPDLVSAIFDRLVHRLFWLLERCLPPMISAGSGAVVIPSSATVLRTSSHPIAGYEAARAAQMNLVRSVGSEVARHGVRVNGVAPNFIENPSYFPPEVVADPTFRAEIADIVPARRLGTGVEAAALVRWLASDEASYLFGAVVPIDGGWSIG